MEVDELRRYRRARKDIAKNRAVRIFFYHFGAYVLGNIFLGAWNVFTYQNLGSSSLWFFSPLIFWGVGVIIHYVQGVALFDEWWDQDEEITGERLADEEIDRLGQTLAAEEDARSK